MKKDELLQLSNKPEIELRKDLASLEDRLWLLKNDLAAGKVKNVREIKKIKKTIARILTILNAKK